MMYEKMMENSNNTTINLETYFKETRAGLGSHIMQEYGFNTSSLVVDFIDDFYYAEENACMDTAFFDFADGNTAIYDSDLYDWLTSGNASERYIDEILNCGIPANSNASFLSIIGMAMYQEIYEALNESFDELKYCMVAKYLMKMGYITIEEDILEDMAENLKQYEYITFEELFDNALTDCGYDADNCGSKCA